MANEIVDRASEKFPASRSGREWSIPVIRLRIARARGKNFLPTGLERFQRWAEESALLIREAFFARHALGFVATSILTQYMFEVRPMSLFAINAGSALVGMVVMGAILGAWKKPATVSLARTATA